MVPRKDVKLHTTVENEKPSQRRIHSPTAASVSTRLENEKDGSSSCRFTS